MHLPYYARTYHSYIVPGNNPSEAELPRPDHQILGAAGLSAEDPHSGTEAPGPVRTAQSCQGSRLV